MQNTIQLQNKSNKRLTFDLKGSLYGRKEKFKGNDANWWTKNKIGHKRVMKEKNFLEINRDWGNSLINLKADHAKGLKDIILKDSLFLKNYNLMDYSLLLVIENIPIEKTSGKFDC